MKLQLYFQQLEGNLTPYFTIPISAGQAQELEQIVDWIDLDEFVKRGNVPTYYLRVSGDSMEADVYNGDLLVVERTDTAEAGDIVIAEINNEFTVKRLQKKIDNKRKIILYLVPANPNYKPLQVQKEDDFAIWGIVTHFVRKVKNQH